MATDPDYPRGRDAYHRGYYATLAKARVMGGDSSASVVESPRVLPKEQDEEDHPRSSATHPQR